MHIDTAQLKAEVLFAIAHSNRVKIIEFLANGPKCACEIAPALDLEQSNLSRHVKLLIQAGIVNYWKNGKRSMYEISDKTILELLDKVSLFLRKKAKERVEMLEIETN